jgi:alpha-tubulin suppressor-like RCC1 family protein
MSLMSHRPRVNVAAGGLLFLTALGHRGSAQFQSLSLSRASAFACGLTREGRVYCWGNNKSGQLGIGRVGGHRASPVRVAISQPVQAVTLGIDFACALQNGKALCWGTNEHGELGDSSQVEERPTPRPMKSNLRFRSLTAGGGFACGITISGDSYCWGRAAEGQLGAGIRSDSAQGALQVSGHHRFRVLSAASESGVCGVADDNVAYCWGDLARDSAGPISDVPVRVPGNLSFQDVSSGTGYACGLTTEGRAYCWGFGGEGNLGDGRAPGRRYSASPSPVVGDLRFRSISSGGRTVCALDAVGRAYCWGWNEDGQVGDSTTIDRTVPTPVLRGYVFRELRVGSSTTCGITVDDQSLCWGRGADGELGNGTTTKRSVTPVRVSAPTREGGR